MEYWQETPIHSLLRARDVGREAGLRYVYMGNVPEEEGSEDTICPGCGAVVIRRWGCRLADNLLRSGRCPECSQFVIGRWAIGG
jgi:pyruvate formate lyase activating enzyme